MFSATDTLRLNLGCGNHRLAGWVNIDCCKGADVVVDLEEACLPYEENTVDEMLLSHTLEHIENALGLMQELWNIAAPGCVLTVKTPYGGSDDAWEDPTHVRPYFVKSFSYFGQPFYWRADYGYLGDWLVKKIQLFVPPAVYDLPTDEAMRKVDSERNVVKEMVAHLVAVKPAREPRKELQEQLNVRICRCVS